MTLLPCPFCGGNGYLTSTENIKDSWYAACQDCPAEVWGGTIKITTELWNSRTPTERKES